MNKVRITMIATIVAMISAAALFANGGQEAAPGTAAGAGYGQSVGPGRGYGRFGGAGAYGTGANGIGAFGAGAAGAVPGGAQVYHDGTMAALDAMPLGVLGTEEIADLLYLWEEEKLARDVYAALGEHYGLPVFSNIARSEQTHIDQVGYVLDRYGLETPGTDGAGVFANPELAQLYTELVEQGTGGLEEAFSVGIAIEEMDIQDLEEAIELSGNEDVKYVLNQLLLGSQNHLAAFQRQVQR